MEGKGDFGFDFDEELGEVDIEILDRGALDGFLDTLDFACDSKRGLSARILRKLDVLLARLLASSCDGLYRSQTFSQVQESQLRALGTGVLDSASEGDLLVLEGVDVREVFALHAGNLEVLGTNEMELAACALENVLRADGLSSGARRAQEPLRQLSSRPSGAVRH